MLLGDRTMKRMDLFGELLDADVELVSICELRDQFHVFEVS